MNKAIKKRGSAPKISEQEFKRVMKVVSFNRYPERDRLLLLFSYGLGLRAVELAPLKISDVIDESGSIIQHVLLKRTKGNIPRETFLCNQEIQNAIHEYLNQRKIEAEKERKVYSLNQPLFLSQKGLHFTNKTLSKLLKIIYLKSGVKATSHSGRRTFATNLIENGADIKTLQVLLGHCNVSTTMKYIEKNPDRLKKAMLNALY